MIRLTLSDGTRIQLPASDIALVEPGSPGALIVKTSGEMLNVLQDFRTVETRVAAARTVALREAAAPPPETVDDRQDAAAPAEISAKLPARGPETADHRRKRLLLGRSSLTAFLIASVPYPPRTASPALRRG